MAVTYANVLFDTVLTGLEKLLKTEFGSSVAVSISRTVPRAGARQSIRIWPLPMEFTARPAGAITNSYPVEVVCSMRPGGGGQRSLAEQKLELAARAARLLNNNSAYAAGGVYQWHAGFSDRLEEVDEGVRFVYTVLVTEVL